MAHTHNKSYLLMLVLALGAPGCDRGSEDGATARLRYGELDPFGLGDGLEYYGTGGLGLDPTGVRGDGELELDSFGEYDEELELDPEPIIGDTIGTFPISLTITSEDDDDDEPTYWEDLDPTISWDNLYWDSTGYEPACDERYTTMIPTMDDWEHQQASQAAYTAYAEAVWRWNKGREDFINGFEACPQQCPYKVVDPEEPMDRDEYGTVHDNTLPTDPPGLGPQAHIPKLTYCIPLPKMKYGEVVKYCWSAWNRRVSVTCRQAY